MKPPAPPTDPGPPSEHTGGAHPRHPEPSRQTGQTSHAESPQPTDHDAPADRDDHVEPGRLVLVRHGRTPWAAIGKHTGRTDVLLDDVGRAQALALGPTLAALRDRPDAPAMVLCSPAQRALRTAELAGLGAPGGVRTDEDLLEWDYGAYEGMTTAEVTAARGRDWRVLRDGVAPGGHGQHPGESLEQVQQRAQRILDRVRPVLPRGDVVLVGHGHALRVLAATWLEMPARTAERLALHPAACSLLGFEHGVPGIITWNVGPGVVGDAPVSAQAGHRRIGPVGSAPAARR